MINKVCGRARCPSIFSTREVAPAAALDHRRHLGDVAAHPRRVGDLDLGDGVVLHRSRDPFTPALAGAPRAPPERRPLPAYRWDVACAGRAGVLRLR